MKHNLHKHFSKLLDTCEVHYISRDTKHEMENLIEILTEHIIKKCASLTPNITLNSIINIIQVLFPNELLRSTLEVCDYEMKHPEEAPNVFPLGYFKFVLKPYKFHQSVPNYLRSIAQYISHQILYTASCQAMSYSDWRLYPRYVFLGIQSDPDLRQLMENLHIRFIHHGTVQSDTCLPVIPRNTFQLLCKDLIQDETLKISKGAVDFLQNYIETDAINLLQKADKIRQHCGRNKVNASDVNLAMDLN
jgi:histone H3/H4